MSLNTPVLLFVYKRINNLEGICRLLKKIKVQSIYIVADGPKDSREKDVVANVRLELEKYIDWKCELHKNYADTNLGLKERFRTGIDWVFEHTDKAIFIEDDCVPDPSFFTFCDQLLEKYKDNERIVSIAGNNFQSANTRIKESYYYSRYPHVWGWATWKRVWDQYDSGISDWPKRRDSGWLKTVYPDQFFIRKFWTYIYDRLYAGQINTWDYQLTYLSQKLGGYNIIPRVNLVSNIGYGEDATNLKKKNLTIGVPTLPVPFPLVHPKVLEYNHVADRYIEELVYLHPLGKLSLFIKSLLGIV